MDVATLVQLREAARPTMVEHASLAFQQLTQALRGRKGCRILDLGAPNEANVAFYSQFARKFHFEDLATTLADPTRPDLSQLLAGLRDTQPFDLILCWDTLNYLGREELQALALALVERMHQGSQLHAFISLLPAIPESPGRYRTLASNRLRYEPVCAGMKPNPRHSKADLERFFAPLMRTRSFLLRHGMEEFVFQQSSAALHQLCEPIREFG